MVIGRDEKKIDRYLKGRIKKLLLNVEPCVVMWREKERVCLLHITRLPFLDDDVTHEKCRSGSGSLRKEAFIGRRRR